MFVHCDFDETVGDCGAGGESYWCEYWRGIWFGEEGGLAGGSLACGKSFI